MPLNDVSIAAFFVIATIELLWHRKAGRKNYCNRPNGSLAAIFWAFAAFWPVAIGQFFCSGVCVFNRLLFLIFFFDYLASLFLAWSLQFFFFFYSTIAFEEDEMALT